MFHVMAAWLSNLPAQVLRAALERRMARCQGGDTKDHEQKELRILIIGKTGNGKSSVGNAILGGKIFSVGSSMSSTTKQVQTAKSDANGWLVKVVDTPDPVNSELTPEQLDAEVNKWKQMTESAPSAILLAVRCDVRYTAEEYDIYKKIKARWQRPEFCQRLVVAFTFADRQDKDIKEDLKTVCRELRNVLKDASGRYVQFNNMASEEEMKVTVRQLLKIIDSMGKMSLLSMLKLYLACRGVKVLIALALFLFVLVFLKKQNGGNRRHSILPSPTDSVSLPGMLRFLHTQKLGFLPTETLYPFSTYTSTHFEQVCAYVKAKVFNLTDAMLNQWLAMTTVFGY